MPHSALRLDYDQFCIEQAHWLDDYALFRALKAGHGGVCYLEWPEDLVQRQPAALAEARRDLAELTDRFCFTQFLLFRQGKRLREHARAKGVHLIGDLPFFVSPDSSDVWANPGLFLLDEHRGRDSSAEFRPTISAHKGNCGATLSMIGRRFDTAVTSGASTVCGRC